MFRFPKNCTWVIERIILRYSRKKNIWITRSRNLEINGMIIGFSLAPRIFCHFWMDFGSFGRTSMKIVSCGFYFWRFFGVFRTKRFGTVRKNWNQSMEIQQRNFSIKDSLKLWKLCNWKFKLFCPQFLWIFRKKSILRDWYFNFSIFYQNVVGKRSKTVSPPNNRILDSPEQ